MRMSVVLTDSQASEVLAAVRVIMKARANAARGFNHKSGQSTFDEDLRPLADKIGSFSFTAEDVTALVDAVAP